MARVTLQDGRVINFQGTPTQRDIEEVIASMSRVQTESSVPKPTQSKSFLRPKELLSSLKDVGTSEVAQASAQIQDAKARQQSGEQGFGRTATTIVSQGAQVGLSTAFRGAGNVISAAIPDFIEDPIRRKLGDKTDDFLASEAGQSTVDLIRKVSEKIDTLEPKNQQLVRDFGDALMTGVDVATVGGGGKVVKQGAAKVGKEAGKKGAALVESAEKDAIANAQNKLVDLIIDKSTPTKRAAQSVRTTEGGFFKGRTITPTQAELNIVKELVTTPGIKANRSALFNLNALEKELTKEAKALKAAIDADNFIFPKKEAAARLTSQLDELKRTDTDIIGDAETLADKVFEKMRVFVEANEGTGSGALKARKEFDEWVKNKKPKAFEKQDAYSTAVRAARKTVNDFVEEKAIKVEVKKSLQRQSRLFQAQNVLRVKAGKESTTGFIRLLDKATEKLGTKNRIVQLVAAAVGIGGLGAAATFAPAAATLGGVAGLTTLLVKALKSPSSRKALGKVLLAIEKALPKAKGDERTILLELKDELTTLLDKDLPIGLSIKAVDNPRFNELTKTITRLNKEREALIAKGLKENSSPVKANQKALEEAVKKRDALGE
jgi:hypothetical protein